MDTNRIILELRNCIFCHTYLIFLCRQGRLDDFQQTLFDEYMDLTPAASHSSGINIKVHPEPKNIFGE